MRTKIKAPLFFPNGGDGEKSDDETAMKNSKKIRNERVRIPSATKLVANVMRS